MIGGFYIAIGLLDLPVRADQVADPARILSIRIVGRAVGHAYLAVNIAEQIEGKIELVPEGQVVGRRVETDPQYDGVFRGEILDSITESLALHRSPGRIGLRVPPQYHGLPLEFRQGRRDIVLIRNIEGGSRISLFQ